MGIEVRWTPWGILSGILWVSGGTGGIYAIRNAGMATAVGTWASVMVLINFIWGILIFKEPIHDFGSTCCAFFLLGCGLAGMSRYSSRSTTTLYPKFSQSHAVKKLEEQQALILEEDGLRLRSNADDDEDENDQPSNEDAPLESDLYTPKERKIPLLGGSVAVTTRELGILAAVANGILAGSSLIPMHYAKKEGFGGATYIISFGCGSMISNTLFWGIAFLYYMYQAGGGIQAAWDKMPPWYWRQLWGPGLCAGLLLSVGMLGSILAVTYLGQGVGNSLVQSKILISGLWGICWYREITERPAILKWFLSATVTVVGVLWLSYEHKSGNH